MQIESITPNEEVTLQDVESAIRRGLKAFSDGKRTVLCRQRPTKGTWNQFSVPVETDSPEAA